MERGLAGKSLFQRRTALKSFLGLLPRANSSHLKSHTAKAATRPDGDSQLPQFYGGKNLLWRAARWEDNHKGRLKL